MHRTPDDYVRHYAENRRRARYPQNHGWSAGGAAHLPGMLAAKTTVPVLMRRCLRNTWRGRLPSIVHAQGRAGRHLRR